MTVDLLKLSSPDLLALATALRGRRLLPPFSSMGIQRYVASGLASSVADELQSLHIAGNSPESIALMMELVAQDRQLRQVVDDSVDLVTTGPEVQGVTNRDTAVVVRELFGNAQDSVLVAGYAVYQGQRVFQALADRMKSVPSLRVRMFFDIQRNWGDTSSPGEISKRYADRFRQQQWPQDRPIPEVWFDPRSLDLAGDKRSCLHAKCVVVDQQHVFISSANFTEAAQERNIEVGVLIHSRSVAERLSRFFEAMLADGTLQSVF